MGDFFTEIRHVARRLGRAPLFTAVTLLTLAVGIGANSAVFSVIHAVLLKPLPYPDPDRLVAVWHSAPGIGEPKINTSPASYFTEREEGRVFETLALWNHGAVTVTGLAEPERVDDADVTSEVFPVLGAKALVGRIFTPKDDSPGAPDTVILTYAFWQRKFGGDPSAVGRRLIVNGNAHDIIGVMPRDFRLLDQDVALFFPLRLNRAKVFAGNFSYQSIGRLKPGVTLAAATADVARVLPMMLDKFPTPPGFSRKMMEDARIGPNLIPLKDDVVGDVGKILWVLMGTVGIVLLIACANVANLFLVRAEERHKELALRVALGAGYGRIARQLLAESVTLGVAGGTLGLGLAYAGIRLLVYLEPANLPRLASIGINGPVLLFTLLVSVGAGALFGLIPILRIRVGAVGAALKEGGRGGSDGRERHRARNVLAVAQIALALVLLVSAGLMIRTFQAMRSIHPGFVRPQEVLAARVSIPGSHRVRSKGHCAHAPAHPGESAGRSGRQPGGADHQRPHEPGTLHRPALHRGFSHSAGSDSAPCAATNTCPRATSLPWATRFWRAAISPGATPMPMPRP